jgi:glucokinase
MSNEFIIGIDIGGTSICTGLIQNQNIVKYHSTPTGAARSCDEILASLYEAIEAVWNPEVVSIGIGTPGFLDTDKGIILKINNIPAWNGLNLKEKVAGRYKVPVFINNDANCFVLGEKYFGKARRFHHIVGLTLGTGLGGGIIINDKLHAGVACGAGEFGCVPYFNSNFESYCGSTFFSRIYDTTGKELYDAAMKNDPDAIAAFTKFGNHIGNLITNILYVLAPEAVILGGSISKSLPLFREGIYQSLEGFLLPEVKNSLVIDVSDLEHPALLGAAALYYDSMK